MGTKWSDVILSPSLKDSIMSDITTFFDYEEMYTSLIPWKRGIILHGTPRRSSVETTEGDDKDKTEMTRIRELTRMRLRR